MANTILSIALSLAIMGGPAFTAQGGMNGQEPAEVETETPITGGGADSPMNDGGIYDRSPRPAIVTTTAMPPTIRKVSILVESSPIGADIEVDGVYVGVTPVQLSLKEGVHNVKISYEGYLPWQKPVKAYHGLTVAPKLVQESVIKRDITKSATSK